MLAAPLLVAILSAPGDLRLLGIVSSESAEHSIAILASRGRTRIAAVGDSAFGGTLLSIASDRVAIDYEGEIVELGLPGQVSAAPPAPEPSALPPERDTQQDEPPVISLPREETDRRLAGEMARILSETRLVPVREGPSIVGFSIARLPHGTLLSDVGLQLGDVLTELNGVRLDSMATLIGLWPKLQGAKRLRALVLRGGQPVTLGVELQ